MRLEPFAVEEWMNAHERDAVWNIAETCVDPLSPRALAALAGADERALWAGLSERPLTYGDIEGAPALVESLRGLYATRPRVVTAHGAIGANLLVLGGLIGAGDHVVVAAPTYGQLVDLPRGLGARVDLLPLTAQRRYLPDLDRLADLIRPDTRLLVLNNPNNPTGALLSAEMLAQAVAIADRHGVPILCDEVYRDLTQEGVADCPSVVDLYDRGVATGSMSKAWSLAGLRLGWVATRDDGLMRRFLRWRDYTTISCGVVDEALAAFALEHRAAVRRRNLGIVRGNLAVLADWVASEPAVEWVRPSAGTTALVRYDLPMDSYALGRLAMATGGALVTPGDCFGQERSVRIGFAPAESVLRGGLEVLSRTLREAARRAG